MINRPACLSCFLVLTVLIVLSSPGGLSARQGGSNSQNPNSATENKANKHYLAAKDALKNGNLDSALSELSAAAALAPSNSVIWYNVAVVESKKNRPDAALQHLKKAMRLGLPSDLKDQALELESSLKSKIGQKGDPSVTHGKTRSGETDSSLGYFVGSWIYTRQVDNVADPSHGKDCANHITEKWRFVVQSADGPSRLAVKETYNKIGSLDGSCKFNSNGKSTLTVAEQYLGFIYKEGAAFRMSIDDGTCSGDCEGEDLTGATYTLEVDSQDKMVVVYKANNSRNTYTRE